MPARPWEVEPLRQVLPDSLVRYAGTSQRVLVIPASVVTKIQERHPADVALLARLADFFERWEYVGWSTRGRRRLEVYGRVDHAWHTAVIRVTDADLPVEVLATFHRLYERKVCTSGKSRLGSGGARSRRAERSKRGLALARMGMTGISRQGRRESPSPHSEGHQNFPMICTHTQPWSSELRACRPRRARR